MDAMNIKDIIINTALANPAATAGTFVALVGAALAVGVMVRRGEPVASTAPVAGAANPNTAGTVAVVPGTAAGPTPSVIITIAVSPPPASTHRSSKANPHQPRHIPNPINTATANANARAGPVQITPEDQVVNDAPESLGSRAPDGTHRDIADRMAEQREIDAQRRTEERERVREQRERDDPETLPTIPQGVTQVMGRQHDDNGYSLEDELLASVEKGAEGTEMDVEVYMDVDDEEVGARAEMNEETDGRMTVFGPLLKQEGEGRDGVKRIEDVKKMR
ncbi:hypothetical protein HBI56_014210 [Parastagonospora nodorum]|uniref:Uncharacterized protein n=1 Tax=Phaeosphaeria nodorum (strain SN15 / ATCC MYA-4574 / FGSC 10173) TaxID=321614 RepID=A0A7U2F1W1_PHANO|nr:hypothetical protein HBH56_085780 [Parastagonospora nodorum]QRC96921.1 hypothetical protein JI435_018030 [Parastagonospora nodorum SN15]KAH3930016.1 hypothetical protein HBH54_116050 [Parastagonospora nodorum]KAH3982433.1 hypothetical protein HBH52_081490 [Parastagonospora nodorum]KAH4040722.1 hypothetical protein HBI09_013050 [Parastagonospora nodorum]